MQSNGETILGNARGELARGMIPLIETVVGRWVGEGRGERSALRLLPTRLLYPIYLAPLF